MPLLCPKEVGDSPVQDIVSPCKRKGGALGLNLGEQKKRAEISRAEVHTQLLGATLKLGLISTTKRSINPGFQKVPEDPEKAKV